MYKSYLHWKSAMTFLFITTAGMLVGMGITTMVHYIAGR